MNYRLKLKDIHDDKRSLVRAFPKHRKQRTSSDLARFARRLFLRERTLGDSEMNMSAYAGQNYAPGLTCVRLEDNVKWGWS